MLVATSGDTGSAVANAFFGVAGTRVVVLYPEGQVSDVQEAQFTTLGGNVTRGRRRGHVRRLPAAGEGGVRRSRTAVARAADVGELDQPRPAAAADVLLRLRGVAVRRDRPLTISVPSGNFGNLVAGVMAWKMGAPIHCFAAPTTINDTVPRYFASGRVEPQPSVQTLANAMDVGNPSNLERLQWLFDGDLAAMRSVITTERHTDDEVRDGDRRAVREIRLCRRPAYGDRIPRRPASNAAGRRSFPRHRASGEIPGSRASR